jgi:tRNA (cmo5U34)-methyltransferase
MTNATSVFEAHAAAYDAPRRRLVPPFDAFYGTAVDAVPGPAKRVLDLGAGTGLLAGMVAAARPAAEIVLLDGSAAMLDQARARLGDRASYVVGDFADPLPGPDGSWCAVVSALAIHHLDDRAKRSLFARVRRALKPGGVFVNAEQVAGPTAAIEALYARWHADRVRAAGSSEEEWRAALERMEHDRLATAEDQLRWLREAGFADVDCRFSDHRFAVLVAQVARP